MIGNRTISRSLSRNKKTSRGGGLVETPAEKTRTQTLKSKIFHWVKERDMFGEEVSNHL